MSSLNRYKTRDRANSMAARIPMIDPATGDITEDWLDVRSSLSDEFRSALDDSRMAGIEAMSETDDAKRRQIVDQAKCELAASLVSAWSFDEPCTPPAVAEFLREAPQVYDSVIAAADDRNRFFGNGSENSAHGSEPNAI